MKNTRKNLLLFFIILQYFVKLNAQVSINAQAYLDSLDYYYKTEQYNKAIFYGDTHINNYIISENSLSIQNYLSSLYKVGFNDYNHGNYKNSKTVLSKAIKTLKKIPNKYIKREYSDFFDYAAYTYIDLDDLKKAEYSLKNALIFKKKTWGVNSTVYAKSLNLLAYVYHKQNEFTKAEKLYLEAISIIKKALGTNNYVYSKPLYYLALLYINQGKLSKAELLLNEIKKISKTNQLTHDEIYPSALDQLSKIMISNDFLKKGEHFILESLNLKNKLSGQNNQAYLESLDILIEIYDKQVKYKELEQTYKDYIHIQKNIYGNDNLALAEINHNLAFLYNKLGKYKEAESLFIEAKRIYQKNNNILGYAYSLDNLGVLYIEQGIYNKAERLILVASTLFKKINNMKGYAMSLNDLATLYKQKGIYSKSETLFKQALEIRGDLFDLNNPEYLNSLNNLGELYLQTGQYDEALILFKKVLAKRKIILGTNHPYYALSLNNIAIAYKYLKQYDLSEYYYLDALEKRKAIFGTYNHEYFITLIGLADLYLQKKQFQKAKYYLELSFSPFLKEIKTNVTFLSSIEIENYSNHISYLIDYYFSCLNLNFENSENLNIGSFEINLFLKNLSLRNQNVIKNKVYKSNDTLLISEYNSFIENKKIIASQQILYNGSKITDQNMLKSQTEELEKNLIRKSSVFNNKNNLLRIKWTQVANRLKKDEIIIDFIKFKNHLGGKNYNLYGAFVLKKGFLYPLYISLFKEEQLKKIISNASSNINEIYTQNELSKLFLNPLINELKDVNTIYISPSGLGHQINFAALPINNTTLGEKYKLHLLGSSAELLEYKPSAIDKNPKPEILLYGGIDYDKSSDSKNTNTEPIPFPKKFNTLATRSGISQWSYLKGTKKEIEEVRNLALDKSYNTSIINDQLATKQSILKLDGRNKPYILHLATHGFFFPDPKKELLDNRLLLMEQDNSIKQKKNIYKVSENPMIRSGLLFAGANKYWGKDVNDPNIDNGILTAAEISNIDLSACKLVVLSACDTGLGDIKGSEGVFGLQRAFKMAGVKNIIMSLWSVPDEQTVELFKEFYKSIFEGKTIHEAFKLAQAKMKEKYAPYYWAGFVLLE